MHASRRSVAALAMAILAMSACKAKPAPVPAPVAAPPSAGPPPARRVNQDSIDAATRRAADAARIAAAAEEVRKSAAAITEVRAKLSQPVYFDFQKDEIRDDQRAALDAKVPILNANANVRIRIAGNTDDRGSDEFNFALGQRRAATAKRYLVSRGIAESRIDVVSYGEERPAAQGATEDSWAKNRRDEFEIVSGGDALRVPR